MDTQDKEAHQCPTCGQVMKIDQTGKSFCETCQKTTPQKELYEEAFFDLKEYQK